MNWLDAAQQCDHLALRRVLSAALIEADKCHALVAIDNETALAVLDEKYPPPQSSAR